MAFRKGERVMCVGPDGVAHHGTVTKGGDKKISMAEDGGKKTWSGHPKYFNYSPLKAPKDAVEIPTWKKGDRVMFESKDRGTIHGTVEKGGSGRITVMEDGGEFKWTIDGRALKVSAKELPKDDFEDPMAGYEVKAFRRSRIATDEGYPWEAKIYKDGQHVIDVNDPATGGPVNFWPKKGRRFDVVNEAQEKAKQWFMCCGCPEEGLPSCDGMLDMWVQWYAEERPRGLTGKMYYEQAWKDFAERIMRTKEQNA